MPTGTSSPYYPEQPEPLVALEPDDSYFLVRLRDAQAWFDGGFLGRGGVLTVQSTVESSFHPGTPTQSIHQTALIQNGAPCRLGTCTNLTDWLPAHPNASLRVTLKYSLLPKSAFQGLAGLIDKLKPVAKLTLHDPEWAVALKVSETVARLMATAAGAGGQKELLSLVLDLNVADLKAGCHAVLGSRNKQVWPSFLSINENRHLVAHDNALSRLCYALIEVLALKRLGPEAARGAPWWEVLQAGRNRALETPSPNDEQRRKAIGEWCTTLALARTLARNERGCLPNEISDLIRASHVEVESVLAPRTTAEGQLDDELPSQWQRLLELNTGRELRSSASRYDVALEESRRVLDQYGTMPGLSTALVTRCSNVLRKCSEFDEDRTLSAVFGVIRELHDFKSHLPQASNKDDRILKTLDFLLERRLQDGRPVAPFLRVLVGRKGEGDSLRIELARLAEEVDNELAE